MASTGQLIVRSVCTARCSMQSFVVQQQRTCGSTLTSHRPEPPQPPLTDSATRTPAAWQMRLACSRPPLLAITRPACQPLSSPTTYVTPQSCSICSIN